MIKKNNTFLLIFILSFLCLCIKIIYLGNASLGQDTTSYIFWLQSIFVSERFFPIILEDSSIVNSLLLDDKSFIYNFLKPIYSSTTILFTIVSLIYFYIGSLFLSATVESQIILSIFANTLAIFLLSTFFLYFKKYLKNFNYHNQIALILFFFLSTNSFFYGFATYGTHNVGIFFLFLNLIYLEKYLKKILSDEINLRFRLKYFFIQFLALYSMYTNVFLIITCASLSIFFLNKSFKIKFNELIKYITFTFIQILPALILLFMSSKITGGNQGFLLWGEWAFTLDEGASEFEIFKYLKTNLVSWFAYNSTVFGLFSFIVSCIGIYLIKIKFKINVLFYFLISHFLISILMAGFNYAQQRTSAYLLPINSVGLSIFFYFLLIKFNKVMKNKKTYILKILYASLILITMFEVTQNINKLINPTKIYADWSSFYKTDNKYKEYLNRLDVILPNNNLIITDSNRLKIILSTLNYPNKKLNFILALDALSDNYENKKDPSRARLNIRKLGNVINKKIYFVIPDDSYSKKSLNKLESILCLEIKLCKKKLVLHKDKGNQYQNKIKIFLLEDL